MSSKEHLLYMLDYSNLDYTMSNTAFGCVVILTDYYQFHFDFDGDFIK